MKKLMMAAGLMAAFQAQAKLPAELEGYKAVKFGMTQAQVKEALPDLDCHKGATPGMVLCSAMTSFDLVGVPARYLISISEVDKVESVMISLRFPDSVDARDRMKKFTELETLLTEKYGEPDSTEKPGKVVGDITYGGATWKSTWDGPTNRTYLGLRLWGNKSHEVVVAVSYTDLETAKVSTDAFMKMQKEKKAKDADKL